MFKCMNCGCEFEELAHWTEDRGEYWGVPCREDMYGCPNCYDDAVEEISEDDEYVDDDEELERCC